jgi:hypothetical protein
MSIPSPNNICLCPSLTSASGSAAKRLRISCGCTSRDRALQATIRNPAARAETGTSVVDAPVRLARRLSLTTDSRVLQVRFVTARM